MSIAPGVGGGGGGVADLNLFFGRGYSPDLPTLTLGKAKNLQMYPWCKPNICKH